MDATTQPRSPYHARRPGVLGVHSLDHFSLSVPDAPVSQRPTTIISDSTCVKTRGTLELHAGNPITFGACCVRAARRR